MKIQTTFSQIIDVIITDEDEYIEYTRYNRDCWFMSMGESTERLYDCEEIEKLYQDYLKEKVNERDL